MKCSLIFVLAMLLGVSRAGHVLFTHNFPYTHYNPYALAYSYFDSPVVHPYTYGFALKHHHPDHKGDGTEDAKQPELDSKPTLEAENSMNTEIENIATLPEIMPQKIADLKQYSFSYPIAYTIPRPLSWPTASKFHRQDELGQYHYGYANALSTKQEIKTLDGITRGSYSYLDSNNKLQTVDYISDILGFRVAATNLPKSPVAVEIPDSEEIRLAKEEHFKAQKEALMRLAQANSEDANDVTGKSANI